MSKNQRKILDGMQMLVMLALLVLSMYLIFKNQQLKRVIDTMPNCATTEEINACLRINE